MFTTKRIYRIVGSDTWLPYRYTGAPTWNDLYQDHDGDFVVTLEDDNGQISTYHIDRTQPVPDDIIMDQDAFMQSYKPNGVISGKIIYDKGIKFKQVTKKCLVGAGKARLQKILIKCNGILTNLWSTLKWVPERNMVMLVSPRPCSGLFVFNGFIVNAQLERVADNRHGIYTLPGMYWPSVKSTLNCVGHLEFGCGVKVKPVVITEKSIVDTTFTITLEEPFKEDTVPFVTLAGLPISPDNVVFNVQRTKLSIDLTKTTVIKHKNTLVNLLLPKQVQSLNMADWFDELLFLDNTVVYAIQGRNAFIVEEPLQAVIENVYENFNGSWPCVSEYGTIACYARIKGCPTTVSSTELNPRLWNYRYYPID